MRAILDSKYNEFLLFDEPKMITNFPEFVYFFIFEFQLIIVIHGSLTFKFLIRLVEQKK